MSKAKRYVVIKTKANKWAVLLKDHKGKTLLTVSLHDTYDAAEAEAKMLEDAGP